MKSNGAAHEDADSAALPRGTLTALKAALRSLPKAKGRNWRDRPFVTKENRPGPGGPMFLP